MQRRLFAYNRLARIQFWGAVGAGFAAIVVLAAQSILLSFVVAAVFLGGATLADVTPLLLALVALLLVRAAALWLQEVLAQRAAGAVKLALRRDLLAKLARLGPAFTGGERTGELVNTLGAGVETLDDYITQFLPARALAVLGPVFIFLTIFALDPWTTLVLLVAGPFLLLLLALIGGRAKELTERRFRELSWMSAFFLDVLQGLATLKLFGRSREQATNIEEISRHYGKRTMEVLATAFQTSLVMEWAATAATAFVALEVSFRLMNGYLTFDRALAVLLLTPEFFLPLRQMAIKYHAGMTGKAAAERIFVILDTPAADGQRHASNVMRHDPRAERHNSQFTIHNSQFAVSALPDGRGSDGAAPSLPDGQGSDGAAPALPDGRGSDGAAPAITFGNVAYAYDHGDRPALEDVSFALPAGKITALVGPTGAGKSTVAGLLLRFIEPTGGAILVDGAPLAGLDAATWRRQIAWAPQHPHLFDASVTENIRLARHTADDAAVIAAARAANAHDFILALPDAYATRLGERGARLSGGQRQRIAIARAFLKDAPLLLLDEPTAQLDAANAAALQDALARLMAGRTVLLITHQPEMAALAHQTITLEHGCVSPHVGSAVQP
jgi:ATP-binding cassette subfamily C protein CydD